MKKKKAIKRWCEIFIGCECYKGWSEIKLDSKQGRMKLKCCFDEPINENCKNIYTGKHKCEIRKL